MKMEKPQLKTELVFVTPEMAKAWLQKNKANRSIRRHRVLKLRSDLRNGRFMTTHQGVAFNCNGDLKDGQHRLTAIAEEGIGAWMMVTTGLQNDAVMVVDRNGIRTISDNGTMAGENITKFQVSIAYVAMDAPHGIAHSTETSEFDVVNFIKLYSEEFAALPTTTKRFLTKASIMAAFLRAYSYCPSAAWNRCIKLFMEGVDEDFNSSKERSIIVFRDYCLANKSLGYSNSLDLYRRAQRAIKAFMNAEELRLIKPCEQDLFPLVGEWKLS